MKYILYITTILITFSCVKSRTYKRHTDLHHTKPIQLFSIEHTKDSISCIRLSFDYKADTTITKPYSFALSDTNFRYLEQKRVIEFYGSYYIRENVKSKRIHEVYYNRDVNF